MFSTSNLPKLPASDSKNPLSPKKPTKDLQLMDGRRSQQIDIFIRRSLLSPSAFAKALNSLSLKDGITAEIVELVAALFQGKQHEQVPHFL
jgi:hypothetical protein